MNDNITLLCNIAQVSRCGYYKWVKVIISNKDKEDYLLIKKIFEDGNCKLGWRPIQMHLKSNYDLIMNHKKIKRIKKEYGLITRIRTKNPYKTIAKKTKEHRVFKNILNREFEQNTPGVVLCTDITYLYYKNGQKAYLSAIKDVATKEIVSWQVSRDITMKFVLDSIKNLKKNKIVENKTIIHSDQGFHYTNPEYIKIVKDLKLKQSMSRKGTCWDNAPIESFFGHLKDDVDYSRVETVGELSDMINNYMDYYNNKRFQWDIKKMTPAMYRNHLLEKCA